MVWLWILVIVSIGVLLLVGAAWVRRDSRSGKVLDVRRTPRRTVEEMTVDEFRGLGHSYLEAEGFEVREDYEDTTAVRAGSHYRVFFDPVAEAEDLRYLNRLVVQMQSNDVEGGWLITAAELSDRGQSLASRANLRVLDPETLVPWQRRRDSEPDEGTRTSDDAVSSEISGSGDNRS